MISRLFKQALAGLHYTLTIALSVVVIVIAFVVFRELVDEPVAAPTTTTTTTTTRPSATTAGGTPQPTTTETGPDCVRNPLRGDEQTVVIRLYFECGTGDEPTGTTWVYREIAAEGALLTVTMQQLVGGPSADERRDGFRSFWSPATADAVLSVARDGGAVVVDLRDLGPQPALGIVSNGRALLAEMNNTLFQHEVVESVEYRIEGSCDRFWSYLGEDGCAVVGRAEWQEDPAAARGEGS